MFKKLDNRISASAQITVDDVKRAAAEGFGVIVNNRPEDESPDQTPGSAIEAAAQAAGLEYFAIPIGHTGFSAPQIAAMQQVMADANDKRILAYCRSGTRSTFLWSLAEAGNGRDPQEIVAAAAGAGYDVSHIRPQLDMLAAQAK
ncbi:MAG: TIGR01244 family phosphatase [Sphingomonadales bacterium]|nr:TIGR01244 family phosphatase [Sphingomonadales bacterium]MDE2569148.1 TIGR01244 family phosphatase [Sphingomonadales bacterium]